MANRDRRFDVDCELGRKTLRRLGSLRPLLGAAFALVVYLALRSNLVSIGDVVKERTDYFYGTIAFLAGFSERWAKVVIEGVMGGVDEAPQQSQDATSARQADDNRRPSEASADTTT